MFVFNRTQGLMSQLLSIVRPVTRRVRVRVIYTLSPRTYRVVFTDTAATNLTDLTETPPGAAIKLMLPYERADNGRTLDRTCTIRRYHAARREFEIDFIVHDEIPAAQHSPTTRWLEHAAPGDEVEFTGSKQGFRADPAVPWTLFIGNETVLPAIFAILETLSEHVQMLTYITIGDARARPPLEGALTTHPRSRNIYRAEDDAAHVDAMTVGALGAQAMPADTPQVFLAGKTPLLRQVHTLPENTWTVPHDVIDAKGYWTAGLSRGERKASEIR